MKRICLKCGKEFEGSSDSILCRTCAKESIHSVVRIRTCCTCGASFPGYPASKFCSTCAAIRKRETNKAYLQRRRNGETRPIGSSDICAVCGEEYTVAGGLQKYCPNCAPEAIAENDREMSRQWSANNIDYNKRRKQRHSAAASIKCVVCGKLFQPGTGAPVTCSPECAAKHHARQHAEWAYRNKDHLNEYQRNRMQSKLDAMTPEELAEYRERINARARENYRKRKEKKQGD